MTTPRWAPQAVSTPYLERLGQPIFPIYRHWACFWLLAPPARLQGVRLDTAFAFQPFVTIAQNTGSGAT